MFVFKFTMEYIFNLKDLPSVAKQVLTEVPNKILLFYGDMGVGKTTLIKEIAKQLGVKGVINSPTFALVNEYEIKDGKVYHFDFYRITKEEEALDMGIEEYLYGNSWCLIEWPQNVENLLPLESVQIHLSILDNGKRNVQLK